MLASTMRTSLLAAVLLAACGGSSPATIETTQFNPSLQVDLKSSAKLAGGMYYRDFVVGTGAPVAAGQLVKVHYVGSLPNGSQFDGNTGSDTPFQFHLGAGEVITGWDEGLAGVTVGSNRQLIIPPSLGYGSFEVPGIPANSILVFNVVIISAE